MGPDISKGPFQQKLFSVSMVMPCVSLHVQKYITVNVYNEIRP